MTWFTGTNVLAPIDYGFIGAYLVGIMILGLWLAVVSLGVNWVWRRGLRLYTAAGM